MGELYKEASHWLHKVFMLHRYCIFSALSGLNIYRGQPAILHYLLDHGDCSQRELADALGVSPASIATSLKRMSRVGYISKQEDEKDRRINRLGITDKGVEILKLGEKECDRVDKSMFAGFEDEEITEFIAMLSRITENLSGGELSEQEFMNMMRNQKNKQGDDKND